MKHSQLPTTSDIQAWKDTTKSDFEDIPGETPVPTFDLKPKMYGFGSGTTHVSTALFLLQINYAVDDVKYYLKTLMADVFVNEYLEYGKFIPSKLHLMSDPASLKGLLSDHEKYLDTIVNIHVVGLPTNDAIEIPGNQQLKPFSTKSNLFLSVQKTIRINDLGKRFFITTQDQDDDTKLWIDHKLPHQWTNQFLSPELQVPSFEQSRGTVISAMSLAISNYTAVLQQCYSSATAKEHVLQQHQ
eukprot:scaffold93527_cov56-Attheya_sp.AAC.1